MESEKLIVTADFDGIYIQSSEQTDTTCPMCGMKPRLGCSASTGEPLMPMEAS